MSSETNDPKPTWTDPAPTTQVPTPTTPVTPGTGLTSSIATAPAAAVTPVAPVTVTPRKKSGAWVNVLLGAAAIIAVGGVAFAVGRSTAPASAATVGTFPGGRNGVVLTPGGSFDPNAVPGDGAGRPGGFFGSGGPTIDGTVASITGDAMTVTLASGDTMTVTLDGDTTYHQSTAATASDVAVGDDVAVRISGGRIQSGNAGGSTTTNVTASDVTISR